MAWTIARQQKMTFLVDQNAHPQTIALLHTRATPLKINVKAIDRNELAQNIDADCFGVLLQYPDTYGEVVDLAPLIAIAQSKQLQIVVASDLLALTLLKSPGELGADIVVGSAQRFGVPFGGGGPHAGFMATKDEHKRVMPGRIIGISKDSQDLPAYRLSLQTREQHIRREKATSNICTAQVLLAVMASMYAVYHGPKGLKQIATYVKSLSHLLGAGLRKLGHKLCANTYFDTVHVCASSDQADLYLQKALEQGINLRKTNQGIAISLDETCDTDLVDQLLAIFAKDASSAVKSSDFEAQLSSFATFESNLQRTSEYLTHIHFNRYHSEHELLRYIHRLQAKDISLVHSMISLGSCTMKLNATAEMVAVTWPEFANIHPFAPEDQQKGYTRLIDRLSQWLQEVTGFAAVSLQPNSGAQGEYAGLLVIRAYHESRNEGHRNVCLIPTSAHGTNPASAAMVGYQIVTVGCNEFGDIDLVDLEKQVNTYQDRLAAMMVTYPSTHGVFEPGIVKACALVHAAGGQVYMDGANMNAQVALTSPGHIGADVCHLNLHKTFCIPHGGGGPGVGPICVAKHLAPFLPGHPLRKVGGEQAIGPVSAAPYGSAGILTIPYAYIAMMGAQGLKKATQTAILNANYMAHRLSPHYPILFTGTTGKVAHEFILDCRHFKALANVSVEDIAKRLMDYGFHAPTMSFPVASTLMVEPTESESKEELDRFCDAMIAIRDEIREIEAGQMDRNDHPLMHAPHTAAVVTATEWKHGYSREKAAYPLPYLKAFKFWPSVSRVDNTYGDRNLICTCPPISEYLN
jgi:glycine dehydrogenase